MRVDLCHASRE